MGNSMKIFLAVMNPFVPLERPPSKSSVSGLMPLARASLMVFASALMRRKRNRIEPAVAPKPKLSAISDRARSESEGGGKG